MTVMDTIRKVQERDEGTARLLLEMALFDAVCDEADRVRPQLEAEVYKAMGLKAAQGLRHLARQPVNKASVELADHLVRLLEISKADDDPQTPYWDARGEDGKFISGKQRRGIFNVLGFATGRKDEQMGGRVKETMGNLVNPEDGNYGRLRTLGQGLVASNDPNLRPAGTVARLIGDIGPEAQKALEPGIRRTAYRYRGTERRPDPVLQKKVALLTAGTATMTPEQLESNGAVSTDQARLNIASTVGVSALIPQVPDRDTAAISLAAGKMPPSVGLMFDGEGKLVSEAMGFNGDHYLPFDLSNLKRLKGGSYVRTRTTGGLTDEDIYTGLLTGARKLTVVSNSGVFSLEFDPSMRGGRRYSDKARQMVDRYGRLVGAINSGELYQNKLPPERIKTLRQDALDAAGQNAEQAAVIFRRREKEEMAAAAFTATDEDELVAQAEATVAKDPRKLQGASHARAVKDELNALKAKDAQTSARQYRLDGQGYKAALKALETEFPYFIRNTSFEPLQQYMDERKMTKPGDPRRPRGGGDMGYTPKGELSPDRAGSLGAPPTKQRAGQSASAAATAPALGGPGAAPTAGGGTSELGTLVAQTLESKKSEVGTVLQRTLRARLINSDQWVDPEVLDVGGSLKEADALNRYVVGDQFAKWLIDSNSGNFTAIAKQVIESKDPRMLQRVIESLPIIKRRVQADPEQRANYPDEAFTEAEKALTELQVLTKPFADTGDLYHVPGPDDQQPQALKEVLDTPPTNEGLKAFMAQYPAAGVIAQNWLRTGTTTQEIRSQVEQANKRHAGLKELAADPQGRVPHGLQDTPQVREDAVNLAQFKDEHESAKSAADTQRAWSLLRLHEVMEITGATRRSTTGAADPFAQAVTKAASTSSRLVWHDRNSPVAKAVAKALASQNSAPLLRRVKMPASR